MIPAPADEQIGLWHSVILGIVEGITEFLPISSTGHLIVVDAFLGHSDPAFEVAIQAGAITAILVRYWRDLLRALRTLLESRQTRPDGSKPANLLWLIVVAAVPAAVAGLLLEDYIKTWLFHPLTVAIALAVGGVAFLWVEGWLERRRERGITAERQVADMTLREALVIGCWQTLALIPGTSRSGATIVGGLVSGFSRGASAEFSFLVGLPVLYGACVLEVGKDLDRFAGPLLPAMLLASAVSFVTALLVVDAFVRFLQNHTFRPFAYYRIVAGIAVVALYYAGYLGA